MKKSGFFLNVIGVVGLAVVMTSPSHADKTREQVGSDVLRKVETMNRLDSVVYILDHKKVDGNTNKRLYRVADATTGELELLNRVRGSKKVNDVVFEFDGNLYMTSTPKKGNQIKLYQSTDGGTDWSNVAEIGFETAGVRNKIAKQFIFNGKLFMVITQDNLDDGYETLAIWSTENGTDWSSQEELSYDDQPMVYRDFTASDTTGYLLVSGSYFTDRAPIVYSATDTTFSQLSEVGLADDPTLYEGSHIAMVDGNILVSGSTAQHNAHAAILTSTDGVTWSSLIEFDDEYLSTYSYANGYPLLLTFQDTTYIVHTDQNVQQGETSIYSTDGTSVTEASLGFEDDLPESLSDGATIELVVSTNGNRLFASVYNTDSDDSYCGVTDGDGVWSETNYCDSDYILGTNSHPDGSDGERYIGDETAVITDQYVYDLSGRDLYRFAY